MVFEDYLGIMQAIARYGHALDAGAVPFDQVVTEDVEFDMTQAGPTAQPGPVVRGREQVLEAMTGSRQDPYSYRRAGAGAGATDAAAGTPAAPRPALSHHTTNSEIVADRGDEVEVRSKYVRLGSPQPGPMPVLIGQYLDTLRRTEDGWRICRRVIIAHGM
jgi:hypothetical protein